MTRDIPGLDALLHAEAARMAAQGSALPEWLCMALGVGLVACVVLALWLLRRGRK